MSPQKGRTVCPDVTSWGRGVARLDVLYNPRISVPRSSRVFGVYPLFLVVPPLGLTGVGVTKSDPRGDTNLLEDYLVCLVAASNIGGLVCCVGVVFRGRQQRPPVPLGGGEGESGLRDRVRR